MGVKIFNSLHAYIKKEYNDIKKIRISLEEVFTRKLFLFTGRILQFRIRKHHNCLLY